MKIDFYKVSETVIVARNWYTDSELQLIWGELDKICRPDIMQDEKTTNSSKMSDGSYVKKGHGIFLDELYLNDRSASEILKLNNKIFDRDFLNEAIKVDRSFTHIRNSKRDSTLLNYYEDGHKYNKHWDSSIFTACLTLWREPKQFIGGRFLIEENDFDVRSNDMVIFPGYIMHQVTQIEMNDNHTP